MELLNSKFVPEMSNNNYHGEFDSNQAMDNITMNFSYNNRNENKNGNFKINNGDYDNLPNISFDINNLDKPNDQDGGTVDFNNQNNNNIPNLKLEDVDALADNELQRILSETTKNTDNILQNFNNKNANFIMKKNNIYNDDPLTTELEEEDDEYAYDRKHNLSNDPALNEYSLSRTTTNNNGNNNNAISDLLNTQYFSPNNYSNLSPAPQSNLHAMQNNQQQLAFSPSSYNESFDPYNSLNSPITPMALTNSFNNNASLNSPLVRTISGGSSAPKQPLSKEEKLKRRREFHNAVERRRRDHIKERIKDLSKLVPPMMLLYDCNGKEIRPNKALILSKSVEYMRALNNVLQVQKARRADIIEKIKQLQQLESQE